MNDVSKIDEAEAKYRAEWLNKHNAPKSWLILTESEISVLRKEFSDMEREINEVREHLGHTFDQLGEEQNSYGLLQGKLTEAEFKIAKIERECDEMRDVLSEISLYLAVGMGDDRTTAKQYYDRIIEGIKMLTEPIVKNWNQVKHERKEMKEAIENYYKVKGRHNSQIAAAKMFELVGLPTEYPANYQKKEACK
jgi:septal ring factor EnvC (AmiA/AmiB activator)